MNSPYEGKFKVSQPFTLGVHDGLDLVGIDSKEIHSCANSKVIHVGWQNPNNHSEGFGYYVATEDIAAGTDGIHKIRYYGHMTENSARVKVGDTVKTTDVLGVEGHTGYVIPAGPGGAHCHYEIRAAFYKGAKVYNVSTESGIPNVENGVYDDGYRTPKVGTNTNPTKSTVNVSCTIDGKNYSGTLTEV